MAERWLHYEFAEKLGESHAGISWQAYDLGHERIVVVRLFKPESRFNATEANRLTARFARLCQENPDRFAEIFTWDVHDHQQYIVREYIPGESLESILGQPMETEKFFPIAKSIAESVDILHATNVVHGNITANNIIVSDSTGLPRLTDAGIPPGSHGGDVSKYLIYRAPELIAGRSLTESSDLFALGVVFYRLLTGNSPYRFTAGADTEREILSASPDFNSPAVTRLEPELKLLLERLLAKDPADRTPSAEHLIVTLDEIQSFLRKNLSGVEAPSSPSPGLFSSRQYVIVSLIVLALVILYFIVTTVYK